MQKNNCEIITITWRKQQIFHLLQELSEELIFQAYWVHANQKHSSPCSSIMIFLKMFFVLAE